jgi:hypothetical protein
VRTRLLPIQTAACKLELLDQYFEQIEPNIGKVKVELLAKPSLPRAENSYSSTASIDVDDAGQSLNI